MQVEQTTKPAPKFPRIQSDMLDRLSEQAEKLAVPTQQDKKSRTNSGWASLFVW